jgi:hypothetical protein
VVSIGRVKAEVHSPDNLDWTVKRLWVVHRPMTPEQALDQTMAGSGGRIGGGTNPGAAVLVDTFLFLLFLPLLPIAIALRYAGILPWTIQARCRPWGRRGPPTAMRWRVNGNAESERAFQEIVSALERGDGSPSVAGAHRVR